MLSSILMEPVDRLWFKSRPSTIPFTITSRLDRLSIGDKNFPVDENKALQAVDNLTQALESSRTSANSDPIITSRVEAFLDNVTRLFQDKLKLAITEANVGGRHFDLIVNWIQDDSIHMGGKGHEQHELFYRTRTNQESSAEALVDKASNDAVTDSRSWYLVRCKLLRTTIQCLFAPSFNIRKLGVIRYDTREWKSDVQEKFEYLTCLFNDL
ncbi:hypothetical protein BGZ65_005316 [Modicella reniformis]|uniref:Uncharacterized protein n=1 Tax=Modicella reniformis TaxID=1440133 RepID=A0A9P6MGL0_9FUNG|nr:hypothetical protein BGZ65_005316 [Modicella reniformis]